MNYNKENILNSIPYEHKITISNVLDKALIADKTGKTIYTDFYDSYQQKLISIVLKKININFKFYGGYENAERKILILNNDYELDDLPLSIINISYNTNFGQSISHRDVLGTVISKGIKREKLGDILLNEGNAQLIIIDDISSYLQYNLDKINNVKIEITIENLSELLVPEIKYKEINTVVASLRLDCILDAGFSISRSKASSLITSENVSVNSEKVSKSSYIVNSGDIISVRKHGRIILESINGKTKKDRFSISIKKLI